MNTTTLLYPILSFFFFYFIDYAVRTAFLPFALLIVIGSGVLFLIYLESKDRNKISDIGSLVIYTTAAISMFTINKELNGLWFLLFIPFIVIPVSILYYIRLKDKPAFIPVLISGLIPFVILGSLVLFSSDYRNNMIALAGQVIEYSIIEPFNKLPADNPLKKENMEYFKQITANKEAIAKQSTFIMPAVIFTIFSVLIYLVDRFKPLVRENKLIKKEFRMPDFMVWGLILGGFFILAPNEDLKYICYNTLIVYAVLYFFQGINIVNMLFDKYNISLFTRSMLFFVIIVWPMFMLAVSFMGLFSIWFKDKIFNNVDKEDNKEDGNSQQ